MARVLIGIPIRHVDGEPGSKTMQCLANMKATSKHAVELFCSRGQQITQNSVQICNKFLGEGWDYLLYTGDDITFPPHALDRMIAHNKDIVAGLCTWKSPPYWTTGAMECDDGRLRLVLITPEMVQQRALLQVDAVGSGFMLISRKALEAVDDYFRNRLYPAIPEEFRWAAPPPYFPVTYNPQFNTNTGSDFSFCKAATRAGCEIFLDCGVVCGHRWEYEFSVEDHWRWLDNYTFNTTEPPYPGAPLDPVPAPKDKVYWGEGGGPMSITLASDTDRDRAENDVFPILKATYVPLHDLELTGKTDAGYILGFGVDEKGPDKYLHWAKRFARTAIHWNLEDIEAIPEWMDASHKANLNNGHFAHMVEDENTFEMLKTHFRNVNLIPIPTARRFPVAPFPENFTVFVPYDKQYDELLDEVVRTNPDVKFKFFAAKDNRPEYDHPNMMYVPVDDDNVYAFEMAKSSAILSLLDRPIYRDTRMMREAAIMGRRPITNYDVPFTNRIPEVPTTLDVTEVLERIKGEQEHDAEQVKHYFEANDLAGFRKAVADVLKIDPEISPKRFEVMNAAD